MDRYPGYESMLARVEQKKVQVKGQLPTFYSHLVDNMVAFVLDQVNECCNVATVDATTDTTEDHLLPCSNEPVAREFVDDTRVDVSELVNTANPQVDHQRETASGSISNEQSVSPPSPQSVTQSTIPASINVKVEDESNGQSVQLCKWIKKEEYDDDYEEQLFHCCDCGGEGCEECKVKREIKEELDESGETEQMEDCVKQEIKEELEDGEMMHIKEEEEEDGEVEGEKPNKIQRMDHDNNSTLNPAHIDQDDEETEVNDNQNDDMQDDDETFENGEDPSAGDEQVQVLAENFVKRIEPADELGNKFGCDYRGCGKRMKKKTDLISHIRTHIGEKPFKCTVNGCDRAFVQKAQLKEHLNVHSGDRPFVCTWPRCEARFGSKANLTVHLRSHTGSRPFVCTWPECGQAFTTSSNLKKHSHVHSNERQFVCDVRGCTKVYKLKAALLRHQKDKHN